jgi:hypothetical protein
MGVLDSLLGDPVGFVLTHKWWFIACVPFVIAVMVLRARG